MMTKSAASKRKLWVGDSVGRWTVIGEMRKEGKGNVFPCRFACGTEKTVAAISLWNGNSQSCGCEKHCSHVRPTEEARTPDPLQLIFDLISQGHLPPVDGIAMQGYDPTWNLKSIAEIIGVCENQLIHHLSRSPPRSADELKLT